MRSLLASAASALRRKRRQRARGISMIEGLAAMGILVVGLLGTLQGIAIAATQNSTAARMSRANSISRETRVALEMQGRSAIMAGPLSAANCKPLPVPSNLLAYVDPNELALVPTPPGPPSCYTDFDAYELAAPTPFVPGYSPNERRWFHRMLLLWPGNGLTGPGAVPDQVEVIVSFRGSGRTIYSKQFVGLYDPALNKAGVEL